MHRLRNVGFVAGNIPRFFVQRCAALLGVVLVLGVGVCAGESADASAQPSVQAQQGFSPDEVMAALSTPFSVPAGQTTTISLPVPANASYEGGGWSVSAAGTSVTITAPPEGGTINVPVSAQGRTATITLVAEPTAAPSTLDTPGGLPGGSDSERAGDALPAAPGTTPPRTPAREVDESKAETLYLDSQIAGNTITVKLGLTEAATFYSRFGNLDQDKYVLRYVDAAHNIIENVSRDINVGAREMILTYPEGEAPDNPFIMQLVRKDGSGVDVQAVLRDPNYHSAAEDASSSFNAETDHSEQANNATFMGLPFMGIIAVAGVGVMVILTLIIAAAVRRRGR